MPLLPDLAGNACGYMLLPIRSVPINKVYKYSRFILQYVFSIYLFQVVCVYTFLYLIKICILDKFVSLIHWMFGMKTVC
jgi:hypothetical protein